LTQRSPSLPIAVPRGPASARLTDRLTTTLRGLRAWLGARLLPILVAVLGWRAGRGRAVSLRTRLALATSLAVLVGIGGGVGFAYVAIRQELMAGADRTLAHQVDQLRYQATLHAQQNQPGAMPTVHPLSHLGQPASYLQVVSANGRTAAPDGGPGRLAVTAQVRAVAAGSAPPFTAEARIAGDHVRVRTDQLLPGFAVRVALSVSEIDGDLARLDLSFCLAALAGVGIAAALGLLVARTALGPVARLTAAAERVASTQDLAHRISEGRSDELGRLADSFNAMLDAVQRATVAQRQLVADASHELRTPLTSLRTNVEVLARGARLEPAERDQVMAAVLAGSEQLSSLVADIVELARGEEPTALTEEFRFDRTVRQAIERVQVLWPGLRLRAELRPTLVHGVPGRVDRAVVNLLENAAKFSPAGGLVEVRLDEHGLRVRDHGPGIPPSGLPHVFDRFYRAEATRSAPGFGLGLAIVKQVADSHGGTVSATNAPDGGAVFCLSLPSQPAAATSALD
jgi:two-component system sensor histidine kinase MprB